MIPFKHGLIIGRRLGGAQTGGKRAGVLPLIAAFAFLLFVASAEANIYATDVKLDGSTNNAALVPGQLVQISYILNEPATGGVSVRVYSGTNILRTLTAAPGAPGALAGSNSMIWDCKDQASSNVAPGVYGIQISAAANGYSAWTNITDDGIAFQVPQPTAIAVNCNTNSPFYGRVFISSAPANGGLPGIFKFNADGSPADEGNFSDGGYPWGGYLYSPWKISIAGDDTVYINDWSGNGLVMSFDEMITPFNFANVLRPDNYPYSSNQLSGPFVQGAGTNTQIWMADINQGGTGIVRWNIGAGGVLASNDTGTVIVSDGGGSALNWAPYDVALDTNGNLYTIQSVDGADNPPVAPWMRVFSFPPYAGQPETAAIWGIGAFQNSLDYAFGVSVDPSATYVGVASRGDGGGSGSDGGEVLENGGVSIFSAGTGQLITKFQHNAIGETNMQCWDVAWDNVGNLYTADGSDGVWRVYSPPGTNQAATTAVPIVQVYPFFSQPALSECSLSTNQFQCSLQGQSNVTYLIEESSDLANWTVVSTNYSTAANRFLTLQTSDQQGFYRAVVVPAF